MIKFYIENELNDIRIEPQVVESLDTTLDYMTCVLKANNIKDAYAPCQKCILENTDKNGNVEKISYVIVSDTVSVYSTKPLLYTHALQLSQSTRLLSKHLLRNSVFSQPANRERKAFYSICNVEYTTTDAQSEEYTIFTHLSETKKLGAQYWLDALILNEKEKLKSLKYKIVISVGYYLRDSSDNSFEQLNDFTSQIGQCISTNAVKLHFYDVNDLTKEDIYVLPITSETKLNAYVEDANLLNALKNSGSKNIGFYITNDYGEETTDFDFVRYDETILTDKTKQPKVVNFQFHLDCDTYYFTAYDVLETILKEQRQKTNNYENELLFNLPPKDSELYNLLNETIPPSLTFTQSNIYDAIQEIFNIYDATFYLDTSNTLQIRYLNERNNKQVNKNEMCGETSASSEEKYNNGLITYYQNAIKSEIFPSNGNYAKLRNTDLGVSTKDVYVFYVPHNIDSIISLNYLNKYGITLGYFNLGSWTTVAIKDINLDLDLSQFCYEKKLYSLLDKASDFPSVTNNVAIKATQINCVYYTSGTDYINVYNDVYETMWDIKKKPIGNVIKSAFYRYFGIRYPGQAGAVEFQVAIPDAYNWSDFDFRCEYLAKLDGRAKAESSYPKYEGEYLVNQGNGVVDLDKLGVNVFGLTLKLGNNSMSFTHKATTFSDRIRRGQIYIDNDNSVWVANKCTYVPINEDTAIGNITFIKNFNALAQNVKLDNQKRLSNISSELTQKCTDNYCEYLYFAQNETDLIGEGQRLVLNGNFIANAIKETLKPTNDFKPINLALFSGYNSKGGELVFGNDKEPVRYVFVPLIKYGFGNAFCYEMNFASAISAGNRTRVTNDKNYTDTYFYTDDNGWCDLVSIDLLNTNFSFDTDFPFINIDKLETNKYTNYGKINKLEYFKKPNEIFGLNYELICLPMPNKVNEDFIGREFIQNGAFVKDTNDIKNTYFYYETSEDKKYSIMDLKAHGTKVLITNVATSAFSTLSPYKAVITLNANLSNVDIKSWAIANSNGDLLLSSNYLMNKTLIGDKTQITLYFLPRHNRLL